MLKLILALLIMCVLVSVAHADYIDLTKGGMVTKRPVRCDEDRPQFCFFVEKDNKQYIVVHDQKGELKIYEIIDRKPVLIWGRELM